MNQEKENPVKIIRWSGPVLFPSGKTANMCSRIGSLEEVTGYAWKMARENGVTVEAIV